MSARSTALALSRGKGRASTSKRLDEREPRLLEAADGAADFRERARLALAGIERGPDENDLARIGEALAGMVRDGDEIQARTIDLGRRVIELRRLAGDMGFKALHGAGLIPFSETTAIKLATIAEAVERGKVTGPSLPRATEAAYLAARADDEGLRRLQVAKALRPGATVREVRDALRAPRSVEVNDGPLTPARRTALERQMYRLLARAREIEARLARP